MQIYAMCQSPVKQNDTTLIEMNEEILRQEDTKEEKSQECLFYSETN